MAAVSTIWGKCDCLIDLFGSDAHDRISWLSDSHNETLGYVVSLSSADRWKLFRDTAVGNKWERISGTAKPGDAAIGKFHPPILKSFTLPNPWFAILDDNYLWHVRLPRGLRVVDHDGEIEVFRKWQPQ